MTNSFSKPNRPYGAFTLIELLVVVDIIAILAAILFPVFGRARENARRSSCQSNLKQLSLAFMQYSQDYDERCVPIRASTTSYFAWTVSTKPYLKNAQVWLCPSSYQKTGGAADVLCTYSYNWFAGIDVANATPKSIAAIPLPAQSPMLIDGGGTTVFEEALVFILPTSQPGTTLLPRKTTNLGSSPTVSGGAAPYVRHFEGGNMAFVDGHVKWYKFIGGMNLDSSTPSNPYFSGLTNQAGPPMKDMDFTCDGRLGDDATAGTAGKWD